MSSNEPLPEEPSKLPSDGTPDGASNDATAKELIVRSESRTPSAGPRVALLATALATLVGAGTTALALVMHTRLLGLAVFALGNGLLASLSLYRISRHGGLSNAFRPLGGDLSLAAATAGLLYGAARLTVQLVAPRGTHQEAWIFNVILAFLAPDAPDHNLLTLLAGGVAILEEVTWRGGVMGVLGEAYGRYPALIGSAVAFAFATAPTLFLLSAPIAGPNPLLVIGALGSSLVWGLIALRSGRLLPSVFSHAFFIWLVIAFPLWRP